jgi:hypothetical protein
MRHLGRHADAINQRGVGVDGLADAHGVRAHPNHQGDFANPVVRMGADNSAALSRPGEETLPGFHVHQSRPPTGFAQS